MNILFISGHYPPHTKGGGEISTHLIAQGLVKLGHTVTVIAEGERDEITLLDGVRVRRLPIPLTKKVLFERRASQKMAAFLQAQLKDLPDYDILHAHDWRSALVLAELVRARPAFARSFGEARTVVTVRDYAQISGDTNHILADGSIPAQPFRLKSILRSQRITEARGVRKAMRAAQYLININYRRRAFASAASHIFISHAQQAEIGKHQDLSQKKVRVIYNPVPSLYLSTSPSEGAPQHILYVGRLEEYKGVGLLVEAWEAVAKKFPNARLTLVGRGAQKEEYERQTDSRGLQYQTKFVDHIAYDRMIELYDQASIVVAPHLWLEPFGRTAVEAMARGKIVVSANIGGPGEIIKDNVTGLLFEAGSSQALTERLSDALSMDTYDRRAMQVSARKWVQENLTIEKIAKLHEDFYCAP